MVSVRPLKWGMDLLNEGLRRIRCSQPESSRWREQVLPVVRYSSLSGSSVFGIVAWHTYMVPEMAVLLHVLTGGESSPHSLCDLLGVKELFLLFMCLSEE